MIEHIALVASLAWGVWQAIQKAAAETALKDLKTEEPTTVGEIPVLQRVTDDLRDDPSWWWGLPTMFIGGESVNLLATDSELRRMRNRGLRHPDTSRIMCAEDAAKHFVTIH